VKGKSSSPPQLHHQDLLPHDAIAEHCPSYSFTPGVNISSSLLRMMDANKEDKNPLRKLYGWLQVAYEPGPKVVVAPVLVVKEEETPPFGALTSAVGGAAGATTEAAEVNAPIASVSRLQPPAVAPILAPLLAPLGPLLAPPPAPLPTPPLAPQPAGRYTCKKIVWDPSMRGQWYSEEKIFFNDLCARLEMIRRTTPREQQRNGMKMWRRQRVEIRAKTASHLEEMKKRVVRDSEATSLELLLDARRANLSGAHLNVSTTLLKKINRHTSKEKILNLVREHRFECLHVGGNGWWHRSSATILDPAMKGKWYEHPLELYEELVAKVMFSFI
jgi:hypothetical protein